MTRFEGRVLFATGGGSGIAAATARRFTAEGGRVAVVDLDGGRAKEVAAELPGAIGLGCDVADETSVADAIGSAREQLGSIDCVLNAAGHAEFGPIVDWSVDRWNRMLTVHAGGTFLVTKHALPIMRGQGRGAIEPCLVEQMINNFFAVAPAVPDLQDFGGTPAIEAV